jgi:hypothetical protein
VYGRYMTYTTGTPAKKYKWPCWHLPGIYNIPDIYSPLPIIVDENFENLSHFLVLINWFIPLHHRLIDAFISASSLTLIRVLWWCFIIWNTEFNNQQEYVIENEWDGPSIQSSCRGNNNDDMATVGSNAFVCHPMEDRKCAGVFLVDRDRSN